MRRLLLSFVVAGVAGSAHASQRTGLAFVNDELQAEYSQGVTLELTLVDIDGAPLDGQTACDPTPDSPVECRVEIRMRATDGSGALIDVTAPDVAVDAAGRARARLTLVDGRHGGARFVADSGGFSYTLTATFPGAGSPLPDEDDLDCFSDSAGTPDGRLCPATATATLLVFPEVPALAFGEDVEMDIGDTVLLAATLTDPNGDADAAGDAVDGPGPKNLAGHTIRFAYDIDDNGRPNFSTELIGEAVTNDLGVAAFEFFADPTFVQAGEFDAGLFAEFPGDDRYGVARTSVSLVVRARGPDPGNTIIEVSPPEIEANGVDTAEITVKLVDDDNNLLGPDADPHEVVVATDLGLIIDTVERDPLDGFYRQTLRAQRKGGTANITVTVDGEDAGGATLVIHGPDGCACASSSSSATVLSAIALVGLRRRRLSGVTRG